MGVQQSLRDMAHPFGNGVANGDTHVDLDMDLDIGPIDGIDEMQLSLEQPSITNQAEDNTNALQVTDSENVQPNKVHLRGLDDLTTREIRAYCAEHSILPLPGVEWIDDTSANLIYPDAASASEALASITSNSSVPLSGLLLDHLRPAKSFTSRPTTNLEARIALITDRKRPRAYETSRFYLMHPEHDPRERRRIERERTRSAKRYTRRRYSDGEHQRRKRRDVAEGFDASMYDDNGSPTDGTIASSPARHYKRNVDSYRPARDRSASPNSRTRDQNHGHRRRSPPPVRQLNRQKELLPGKKQGSYESDLFSDKLLTNKTKKELFPNKAPISNHRRTDAVDATEEAADLFAGKFAVPFTDGASDSRSLANKVTNPSNPHTQHGGFSIRGASSQEITIKGASHVGTIKELFPGKANAGKELFAEMLEGRGRPRMRAADLDS